MRVCGGAGQARNVCAPCPAPVTGARMRIACAYLVTGQQAEPAPRDPRGGGFDPSDAAAFAAASAPFLPGVPQGQSGFASRGG